MEQLYREQLMRQSHGENYLVDMIRADCLIAEKDQDLINLYWAGVQQMKAAPERKLIFSDDMDRLARVIFPGRFVDYISLSIKNCDDAANLPELQKSIMEKISKAEGDLMLAVGCNILALYLRDHPGPENDGLKSSYQLCCMMSKSNASSCAIL